MQAPRLASSHVLVALGLAAACRSPQPSARSVDSPRVAAPGLPASGVSRVERVFGEADPGARVPLVIAIHGLGDTPEAFLSVFDGFGGRARVVALRGLDAWDEGWSWFPMSLDVTSPSFALALESAADRVAMAITEISRARPTCGRLVITGFSQGGMLSYTLAARHPEIHALYVPVAGRLAAHTEVRPGPRDAVVHALHGAADRRVPIDAGRAAVARLNLASLSASLEEYPGVGHTISEAMQRDLFRLVGEAVAGGCGR